MILFCKSDKTLAEVDNPKELIPPQFSISTQSDDFNS